MSKTPLISVIVPIYNVEQYLNQCIDSILKQTYTNLEIILVNDGSPDRSPKICDEYAAIDSRVKVVHKINGGLSDARNAGLDIAKGEFFIFTDSDDFIHRQFVECLYANIGDADMALCDLLHYYDGETKTDKQEVINCKVKIFEDDFLIRNISTYRVPLIVVAWNKLYKREVWNNLRYPIGKIHEDEFLVHHILERCKRVVLCDAQLYYYRQRNDSIMGTFSEKRLLNILEYHEDRENFYLKRNMYEEALQTYNYKYSSYLRPEVSKDNSIFKKLSVRKVISDKRIRTRTKYLILFKKIAPSFYDITLKIYGLFKKNKKIALPTRRRFKFKITLHKKSVSNDQHKI